MVRQEHGKRDIFIRLKDSTIHKISETNKTYDALQYPIMFLYGEDGYSIDHKAFDVK